MLTQAPEELRSVFPQKATVDLADVRLVDANGALTPFVIQRERPFEPAARIGLTQNSASRKETSAGPGTPNLFEETVIFALPPTSRTRTPRLDFNTSIPRFVRKAVIDALTDRNVVVGHLETTLFRLPQVEQLTVWLPAIERRATKVRVALVGQDDGFLSLSAIASFAERGPPETRRRHRARNSGGPGAGRRHVHARMR